MLAMQDAMEDSKFLLVLTLLSKNPPAEVFSKTNSQGQTLFHVLAANAGKCSLEHLQRIVAIFAAKAVSWTHKDNEQRTALHYAVRSKSVYLVKTFLEEQGANIRVNEKDKAGHTPFSLLIERANILVHLNA
mmetsp:Transcript_17911/g.12888  ORF Transcript_17911/g.12888 Transcript_17911/m.12888 type:complete len:132 (+) Transcript_17911:3615-4010(+)